MDFNTQHLAPLLLPVLILAIIVRRGLRERRVKVERMWTMPLLLLVVGASSLYEAPPKTAIAFGADVAALLVGAGLGWWRARLTNITIDPETHELTSKTSPVGVILIAGLFMLRYVLRYEAETNPGVLPGGAGVLAEVLMILALGTTIAQRLEIWIRCQALLNEARANGPPKKA